MYHMPSDTPNTVNAKTKVVNPVIANVSEKSAVKGYARLSL